MTVVEEKQQSGGKEIHERKERMIMVNKIEEGGVKKT